MTIDEYGYDILEASSPSPIALFLKNMIPTKLSRNHNPKIYTCHIRTNKDVNQYNIVHLEHCNHDICNVCLNTKFKNAIADPRQTSRCCNRIKGKTVISYLAKGNLCYYREAKMNYKRGLKA